MNQIIKGIVSLTAVTACAIRFGGKKASAWSSVTHTDITKKALQLLEKEKKVKLVTFYKNYHDDILSGCTEPDNENDIDVGAGTHYYSCVNPKGKELPLKKGYYKNRLGNYAKSARTSFEENYTSAVSLYKSGNVKAAMHLLGRAIHFVEDMGCTVHTSNMKCADKPNNVHSALEKHVSNSCTKYTATSFDKRLLKSYGKDSFGEGLHKLTACAAKYADIITNLDPRAFDDTAKNVLPITQQHVMAILVRFNDDCTSDKGNFIVDKKAYQIKSEVSGLLVTIGAKGAELDEPNKELEQRMTFCLYDDGTFSIKTADGGYVGTNFKGIEYPKMNTKPAIFRACALGKKRFRISSGGTGFEKILANTKGGGLAISDFEPENPAMIWILN